jgi:hypothetical protein
MFGRRMAWLDNRAVDGLGSVQQKVSAGDDATVIVAGRDVITGNVFVGKFARLRDVWIDPTPVFNETDTDRFVGREWLVESVEGFWPPETVAIWLCRQRLGWARPRRAGQDGDNAPSDTSARPTEEYPRWSAN